MINFVGQETRDGNRKQGKGVRNEECETWNKGQRLTWCSNSTLW